MTHALKICLAVLVGVLFDMGLYRVLASNWLFRFRRPLRAMIGITGTLIPFTAVPLGEYFACSRASALAGYMAVWLFFFAGMVILFILAIRSKHEKDLRELDEHDRHRSGSRT